jgi:hypothetical protein
MGALALSSTASAEYRTPSHGALVKVPATSPMLRREVLPVAAVSQELPVKVRAKAQERLEFCRAIIAMKERTGRSMEECCNIVAIREASRFPELLKGGQGGKSQLTLANCHNWLRKLGRDHRGEYRWGNAHALCDAYTRGNQELSGDESFWNMFNAFFLHRNQLSISESYRLAAAQTRKENPAADIPNEHQARYWVKKLDIAAVILARHGEEALKNNFIDFIRRDWTALAAGEMYISDHRVFDLWVRTWNEEKNCWVAVRPWICGMMDARSWYMPGWQITVDNPGCQTIIDTLGLAILNNKLTPPCYFYSDQGKDFQAAGFNQPVTIDGHEHSILRELGIQDVTAIAYNARAKTIERMFGDMAKTFDKWFASYLGNTPSARPDTATYFSKNPEELLSLEQFTELFAGWLEIYHRTPKHGDIHAGKSPAEIWNGRPELRPAWAITKLKYAMLMPVTSTRTVHRGPAISVNNTEFYSRALWPYLDKQVLVKVDRHSPDVVHAFKPDGSLIGACCTRARVRALALDPEERAKIAEGMREQRIQIRHCYTMLEELTGKKHLVSPSQWLLAESDDAAGLKIVKAGESSSVKGASHTFRHHVLVSKPISQEFPADEQPPVIEFKEDAQEQKLAEFGRAMTGADESAPAIQPTIEEFHNFITSRAPSEEDDRLY